MRAIVLSIFVAVGLLGSAPAWADGLKCENTLRVSVLATGDSLADEQKSDIAELDSRISSLAKSHGTVWYYREAAEAEPTPAVKSTMMKVMELVMKYQMPISFSSKPDFSDVIDGDGNASPRTHC